MVASNEDIRSTVRQYLDLVATGTAVEIVALFAEDATLEDPVGSDVLRGTEALRGFYAGLEGLTITTSLVTLRACAGQAAFHFEIVTEAGGMEYRMAPLEVMTFDDAGKILSMRAFWSDEDLVVET
ncbi:nuclear transport factor 2 family protein [Nocardioides lijunqiniae]|uniref:nuclear transport factor 2 family protein n=1 Tax=Nocardioides lijunqiniae TaxID=2760832 RepID=UPI001877E553